jgi:hypothetical protein
LLLCIRPDGADDDDDDGGGGGGGEDDEALKNFVLDELHLALDARYLCKWLIGALLRQEDAEAEEEEEGFRLLLNAEQ